MFFFEAERNRTNDELHDVRWVAGSKIEDV